MDLSLTASERAFRAEVAGWLAAHVPAESLPSMDTAAGFEAHRAWERVLAEAGLSVVSWPAAVGGRDASLVEWLLFEEEYYRAGAPGRVSQNGIFLLAPTLFSHGTPEQQARILPPMARGEQMWAQAWSEPGAGSDLAAVRSRAERTEGGWLLLRAEDLEHAGRLRRPGLRALPQRTGLEPAPGPDLPHVLPACAGGDRPTGPAAGR